MGFKRMLLKAVSVILMCGYSNIFPLILGTDRTPDAVEKIIELKRFLNSPEEPYDDELGYLLQINDDLLAFMHEAITARWHNRVTEAINRVEDQDDKDNFIIWRDNKMAAIEGLHHIYLDRSFMYNENADLKYGVSDLLLALDERAFQEWDRRMLQKIDKARYDKEDPDLYDLYQEERNKRIANVSMLRDVARPVSKR